MWRCSGSGQGWAHAQNLQLKSSRRVQLKNYAPRPIFTPFLGKQLSKTACKHDRTISLTFHTFPSFNRLVVWNLIDLNIQISRAIFPAYLLAYRHIGTEWNQEGKNTRLQRNNSEDKRRKKEKSSARRLEDTMLRSSCTHSKALGMRGEGSLF